MSGEEESRRHTSLTASAAAAAEMQGYSPVWKGDIRVTIKRIQLKPLFTRESGRHATATQHPAPRSVHIARPRRSFPSPFRKAFQSLTLIFLLPFLNACTAAEPRVPGHDSYCFQTKYYEGFDKFFSEGNYKYGSFRPYPLSTNHSFGILKEFYPLTVYWTTVDGLEYKEEIPIPEIMAGMKTKKHWLRGRTVSHEPCLRLELSEYELKIDYILGEMIDKGPAPNGGRYVDARDVRYPVFRKTYNHKR